MNYKSPWLWVVASLVVLGLWLIGSYNNFVSLNTGIDGQWAQVEVQYQRRFDLIPNLVESVKGIFKQEQAVFDAIAKARTQYAGAKSVDEKAQAASNVESALARLLVVVENYPQLKSSENVTRLMDELAGTENRISVERRRFNDLVTQYNTAIKRFPGVALAPLFGFQDRIFFEAAKSAENAPKVQL